MTDQPKPQPHELTEEEVREKFLRHVWGLVEYWGKVEGADNRLEGLAFSILTALDGAALSLPAFIVAPYPHPEDKAYHQGEGEDWYPENDSAKVNGNISGSLHEHFLELKPPKGGR